MDSDSFKKFFGSTMGIVIAVLVLCFGLCACCLLFAAIGNSLEKPTPTSYAAPANCCLRI